MAGHKVYTSSRDWVDNLQTQDYLAELLRQMDYLRDDLINQENFESVGQILSIGSLAFDTEMYHEKEFGVDLDLPTVGDYVMCAKRSGYDFNTLGEERRVVLPADILAIITEEEAHDMVSWIKKKESEA